MRTSLPYLISSIMVITLLFSCGNSKEKEIETIENIENQLQSDTLLSAEQKTKLAYNLTIAYNGFADRFKKDSLAPLYLFKGGDLCLNRSWFDESIKFFNRLYTEYPTHPKSAEALFLVGFIYDYKLDNDDKAGEVYKEYLNKFPNHIFAKDAQFSLQNLGKTDEEIIREMEAQNNIDDID